MAAVAAALGGGFAAVKWAGSRHGDDTPLRHVVISMQENRSFDHYFGYAPWIGPFGPPRGFSQPDGLGRKVVPYPFTSLSTPDIRHDWTSAHRQWHEGAMDGFMTDAGIWAMGFYTAANLPFYYGLHDSSTLCVSSFSSLLGPTLPNRFYLAAGTSGGITTNGLWGYGVFDHPIILDLLDAAGVTWMVYDLGFNGAPTGDTDNVFLFWKNFATDPRTRGSKDAYLEAVRTGRLPQVSFLIPSYTNGWDEHPPADVSVGMRLQEELVTALRESPIWESSAFILTYDEHGGYFDHVRPPVLDAFGAGIRVPTWVISPWAKPGYLDPTTYDTTSILKFLERLHGLPTLASVNHRFDAGTPVGTNYEAAASGATNGPPAPPRDDRADIGDLFNAFTF